MIDRLESTFSGEGTRACAQKSGLGRTRSSSSEARASPRMTAFKRGMLPAPEGIVAMDSTWRRWLEAVSGEDPDMAGDRRRRLTKASRSLDWELEWRLDFESEEEEMPKPLIQLHPLFIVL